MRWLDGVINSVDLSLSKVWEIVKVREAWYAAVHGITKSRRTKTQRLNNNKKEKVASEGLCRANSLRCVILRKKYSW